MRLAAKTRWGSLSAPPDPLTEIRGWVLLTKGKEVKWREGGRKGRDEGGEKIEGHGGEGEWEGLPFGYGPVLGIKGGIRYASQSGYRRQSKRRENSYYRMHDDDRVK